MTKEETAEYRRRWRAANPDKMAAQRARAAAKIAAGGGKGQLKKHYTAEEWAVELRKRAETSKRWRLNNPEKFKAQRDRYRRLPKREAANAEARRRKDRHFPPGLFEVLVSVQGNACCLCGSSFTKENPACADHCHKTKTPRGLLCRRCNTAEGMLSTTGLPPSEWAARLERYLANPPARDVLEITG